MDTQLCADNSILFVSITHNYVILNNNINYVSAEINDS